VVWEAIYKPFGEAEVNEHSSVTNNFRFPGQYYDQETGLYYNFNRYYDPRTGRYITPDPIGFTNNILVKIFTLMNYRYLPGGDMNLYGYVLNNPIDNIDPFGLLTLCSFKCGFLKFCGLYYCNVTYSLEYHHCLDEIIVTKSCLEDAQKEQKQCKKLVEKKYKYCLDECKCE
jgi:RHS repeat-associated protein